MLNGREALKRELEIKSIPTSGFETYSRDHLDNDFHAMEKGVDGNSDATGAPSTVWMDTMSGRNPADTLGIAKVRVDRNVVISAM